MGLIKTICNKTPKPSIKQTIRISLEHNFPTDGNGKNRVFSSKFQCPYGYNGGIVTCYYPNKVKKTQKHAWFIELGGNLPYESSACPIFQKLLENYCPILSLKDEDIREIPPDLLNSHYSALEEKNFTATGVLW